MDTTKFIKIMMLTTSPADGEALNAIRMANAMLQKDKINWEQYLKSASRPAPGRGAPPPHQRRDSFGKTVQEWDEIIDAVFNSVRGSARESIESIAEQWRENRRLTTRQKSAILKFHANL